MEFVCNQSSCCGCNACVSICPQRCITIIDSINELNAVIDSDRCLHCGLCKKVCQNIDPDSKLKMSNTLACYEGVSADNEFGSNSSSGGFATVLGYEFAKRGGYVVGLKNTGKCFAFDITNDPNQVTMFSGSKYVKVSPGSIYVDIREKLLIGSNVLFVGTPCQVAGLKLFLRKDFENLYTVDLICHGTPSDEVLRKYLSENNIFDEKGILFRKKHQMQIFKDDKSVCKYGCMDSYTIGFLNGLFYTNNCYSCKFATEKRISDITIGDGWGTKNEEKLGTKFVSLILPITEKGNYLLNIIKDNFIFVTRDFEDAKKHNHQLEMPSEKQKNTIYFYKNFSRFSMNRLIRKAYPKLYVKQLIKGVIPSKLLSILKK